MYKCLKYTTIIHPLSNYEILRILNQLPDDKRINYWKLIYTFELFFSIFDVITTPSVLNKRCFVFNFWSQPSAAQMQNWHGFVATSIPLFACILGFYVVINFPSRSWKSIWILKLENHCSLVFVIYHFHLMGPYIWCKEKQVLMYASSSHWNRLKKIDPQSRKWNTKYKLMEPNSSHPDKKCFLHLVIQ